jgi:hypothetical protein
MYRGVLSRTIGIPQLSTSVRTKTRPAVTGRWAHSGGNASLSYTAHPLRLHPILSGVDGVPAR